MYNFVNNFFIYLFIIKKNFDYFWNKELKNYNVVRRNVKVFIFIYFFVYFNKYLDDLLVDFYFVNGKV